MSILKGPVLWLTILCLTVRFTSAKVRVAYDSHYDAKDGYELFVNHKAFRQGQGNGNFTFITCRQYGQDKNCTVVRDNRPRRSCPVTLKLAESKQFHFYSEVYPFGPTKAVIIWAEYTNMPEAFEIEGLLRFTIVDLATCQSEHRILQRNIKRIDELSSIVGSVKYLAGDNFFEIIIDAGKYASEYLNKYKIDAEGNFLSKLEPWITIPEGGLFYPIIKDSKSNYLLYNEIRVARSKTLQLLAIQPDGSKRLTLKEWPGNDWRIDQDISTAHNRIGVALATLKSGKDFAEVTQLDSNYSLKLNFLFEFKIEQLELLNLADGGFISAVYGCSEGNCRAGGKLQSRVLKVDSNGKITGSIENVGAVNCENDLHTQVFENETKEYCVAYLCSNTRGYNNFGDVRGKQFADLIVKCFNDEDFTANI